MAEPGQKNALPVTLRQITAENRGALLALGVAEGQKSFVSAVADALEAAKDNPNAYPFGVYAGEEPVGFIMFGYYAEREQYTLWKFLIDRRHQNRGYGKAALKLGLEKMGKDFGISELYTGVALENSVAQGLYASLGFCLTGLVENGMKEMRYVY